MNKSYFNLSDRPAVDVSCNWDVNMPDKSVQDAVLIFYVKDNIEECENLTDMMDVKTTVNFIKPEKVHEKPTIKFRIPQSEDIYVNAITILSDTKTLEVYGDHNIYTDTLCGQALEEENDFYVYEHKVNFDSKINKEVSLKLVKTKNPNHFWVYGILLQLKKISHECKTSTVNYENVEELLKNSHISDDACKAFNFLRDTSLSQRFMTFKENSGSRDKKVQDFQSSLTEMRQYIDYKFQIVTDYLILREKNTNEKLDKIIEFIKSKN